MSIAVGKTTIVTNGLKIFYDASITSNYNALSEVEVLVVGSGGGGGGRHAGGGGGGGVVYKNAYKVSPGVNIAVTVGLAGAAAAYGGRGGTGGNSIFGNITALGGGGGGGYSNGGATIVGGSGGSGGGGAGAAGLPGGNGSRGSGTPGQGFDGGDPPGSGYSGGGGGGAGQQGEQSREPFGGNGGDGLPFTISGTLTWYGGGGGGAGNGNVSTRGGIGGLGGGGNGTGAYNPAQGTAGTNGLGGGGGGSRDQAGTLGGTGVVIVRYPGPQRATGGNSINYLDAKGHTVHTFTQSGTFTPNSAVLSNGSTAFGLFDFSGNKNHGIARNGPTFHSANSGSIEFDGVDDQFVLPASSIPEGEEISFCVWNFGIDTRQSSIIECRSAANNRTLNIHLPWSNQIVYFDTGGAAFVDNRLTFNPTNAQYQGWHYWCFTKNCYTGNKRIYLDGSLVASSGGNFFKLTKTAQARLGSYAVDNTYHRGRVGMVKIYNRELTAAEITENFNFSRSRFGL